MRQILSRCQRLVLTGGLQKILVSDKAAFIVKLVIRNYFYSSIGF